MPYPFLGLCQWRPKSHPRTSAQAVVVRCQLHPFPVAPAVLSVVGRGQPRHALMPALLLEECRLVPPQQKSQSNPLSLELVSGDRGSHLLSVELRRCYQCWAEFTNIWPCCQVFCWRLTSLWNFYCRFLGMLPNKF
ncbi:unnamed protein product [Staurois parvus]|uniref:Uncharacterized protein n=1 Tax=Staurois parvus TaxID=386267 RepID=A0ABN9DB50_9NEOB|nr:unnamed protein product [Staurois parvus]